MEHITCWVKKKVLERFQYETESEFPKLITKWLGSVLQAKSLIPGVFNQLFYTEYQMSAFQHASHGYPNKYWTKVLCNFKKINKQCSPFIKS